MIYTHMLNLGGYGVDIPANPLRPQVINQLNILRA